MTEYILNVYGQDVEHNEIMHLYRYCEVHFWRSATRIKENSKIIKRDMKDAFMNDVKNLMQLKMGQFLEFKDNCLLFFKTYPNAKNWLKWYLNPLRADIFFEACKELSLENLRQYISIGKDTNSQENMGKIFKTSYVKSKKVNVFECVKHAHTFYVMFMKERAHVENGGSRKNGEFSPLKT